MRVTIVAAMAENGVIGDGGQIPWHLPADLKHFRRVTWGRPVIMGRRTFESIGKPLPGRTTIVMSRDPDYRLEGVAVADSWERALAIASASPGGEEIMIAGGGEIYRQALPFCQSIHLTRIEGEFAGSVKFPEDFARGGEWEVVSERSAAADISNPHRRDYIVFERIVKRR